MAKISFYLTNPRKKKETKLFCLISYGLYRIDNGKKKYLPLKYYTNITMLPNLWNKELNRAKESINWANPEIFEISIAATKISAKNNYNAINAEIEAFERTAKDLVITLSKSGNLPTHEKLRFELDKIYKPNKVVNYEDEEKVPKDFFPFIDFFIKTAIRKSNTLKSYQTLRNNLYEYQKEKKTSLRFEQIDIDFYNSFMDYLTNPKTIKTISGRTETRPGLSKNTIGTRIKVLKTFLSEADSRGLKVSKDYKKAAFKKPNEDTLAIYLNEAELRQIHNKADLPTYLVSVRDLFIIGCYTGLRFSDLSQLKKENFTSENTIKLTTQKTIQEVVIPIHPIVKEILEKYNYQLPKAISNQKFNKYLKEVGKLAGITDSASMETIKDGFKVTKTVPKCDLITSHTARRSFASNAFLAEMPSISIMKITGHKTESSFMKYIKMSGDDNARKLQLHKFFNPMQIVKQAK